MDNTTHTSEQHAPPPHHRGRSLAILGGFLLVLIVAGLISFPKLKQRWTAPMGPALDLPTYTPTSPEPSATLAASVSGQATSTSPGSTAQPAGPPTATIVLTATTIPSPTAAPLCGGPPVMTILAVGVDTEDNNYTYGLGGAIPNAPVDFITPKVSVLTIPRDIWVEIPEISDHYGITHGKLNQSYFYGTRGMGYYDGPGEGPGLMARTLDLNFGLRVDHYGALNMLTFVKIVDAVGGIDLYLPTDVDGTPIDNHTEDMGYFYAGNNHFTGEQALHFSRIRKRYNDFTRMDFQNMVLCALRKKLLTPAVLPKIPQIISAFKDSVITDLSLEQISQMACLLPSIKRENILFASLPQEIFKPGRVDSPQMRNDTFILEVDFQVIRDYVQQFMAGSWPTEPKEPTCQ
jgi:LCP family protein required for cell wall assembly